MRKTELHNIVTVNQIRLKSVHFEVFLNLHPHYVAETFQNIRIFEIAFLFENCSVLHFGVAFRSEPTVQGTAAQSPTGEIMSFQRSPLNPLSTNDLGVQTLAGNLLETASTGILINAITAMQNYPYNVQMRQPLIER